MTLLDTMQQDRAAGGLARRKMRIRSGDVVTVSLSVNGKASPFRVILRFKSGGLTVQRPVATLEASTPYEALKLAWETMRRDRIVEQFEWRWVEP
jgi:hypothetical protein